MTDDTLTVSKTHTPSFSDKIWKRLQGASLRPAEKEAISRTLHALDRDAEAGKIAEGSQRVAYVEGDTIVEAGSRGEDMFVVLEGNVEVIAGGRVIERLRTGEVFGEISMLAGGPRTATVRAIDRVVVLRIPESVLDEDLRTSLWEYAAERLFENLPNLPVDGEDGIRIWYGTAKHAALLAGEYEIGAPFLFVYSGELAVDGMTVHAPALVSGGALVVEEPGVRLALLQDPA